MGAQPEEVDMSREVQFTSEQNLENLKGRLETSELEGVNANHALQMIRTIERLRADNKRLGRIRDAAEDFVYKSKNFDRLEHLVRRHGDLDDEE